MTINTKPNTGWRAYLTPIMEQLPNVSKKIKAAKISIRRIRSVKWSYQAQVALNQQTLVLTTLGLLFYPLRPLRHRR